MFTHLHVHTQYSLLDGACKIGELLDKVKDSGMNSCAITDHGTMYGVVEFYQQAVKRGIHPVIGCEMYVCDDMDEKTSAAREYSHLVLLCENQKGYENLIKLSSESFIRGYYYKPRVDYKLLKEHSEGIIALSACLSGDLPKLLLDGREEDARRMAEKYVSIFGENNFFIELQDHGIPEQRQVLPRLIKLARSMNLPLVATNDCHYLSADDADAQEILMCIQTGKTLSDENRMRMSTKELYVKTESEMREKFPQIEEAIENTNKIAERCQVEFDFNSRHLPVFQLDEGQDAGALLTHLCEEGLTKRYPPDHKEAKERLDYELGVIKSMGFVDYFLIVWDFIKYAKDNGILVGPGRGSGAGSIVAYSLDITSIDPLKYNLLFERFLNPERISMPDLDIDFDYERRGEVIDYVARRYGEDHVAQIITFGTMAARAVIRDVGRVMGLSYAETDSVAKMVPMELNITLKRAMSVNPELRASYENNEAVKRLLDTALKLEGMPRHASTHAAGVLITSRPVSSYVPLQTNDNVITTQFPMNTLESLGLLKMDFLGLRTLTVIGDSLNMIEKNGGPIMAPEDIPMDDPAVYKMISAGDTDGIFQLESAGMRRTLMDMQPGGFEDIIAAISLYRPGPMESIPRFCEGKRHPESVEYLHESLKPILDVTYGCMVYQEQVMQIVRDLAGYSMGRSDLVRRAMSKKKHDVMAMEKEYFIHGKLDENGEIEVPGAVRNGIPEKIAEQLFDSMTAFASYAFNKSHAAAYAMVAVQTAWLKLYYPAEFMAAMMNSVTGNTDKVAFYIQYCRKHGISVRPPDVNLSVRKFTVDKQEGKDRVLFGLGAIKNVGHGAIREIVIERERRGPYKSLFDFIDRLPEGAVNKKCVESLIKAGAMDCLPGSRAQFIQAYDIAMEAASKRKKGSVDGQLSLFGDLGGESVDIPTPELKYARELSLREALMMEKEMTGVYISGHPLDEYADELSGYDINYQFLNGLADEPDGGLKYDGITAQMAGIIVDVRMKTTKAGNMMAFTQLEDLYGVTEVLVFPRVYERVSTQLTQDALVVMSGKISVREEESPKLLLDSVAPLSHYKGKNGAPSEVYAAPPADFERDYVPPDDAYAAPSAPVFAGYDGVRADDGVDPEAGLPEEIKGRVAFTPASAAPDKRTLHVRIDSFEDCEEAAKLLMPTPGNIRVLFVLEGDKRYAAPKNLSVSERYNERALKGKFGQENVYLV